MTHYENWYSHASLSELSNTVNIAVVSCSCYKASVEEIVLLEMKPPNSRKRRSIAEIIESVTKKLACSGCRCAAVENCSYTQATSRRNSHPAERQVPKISVRMSRERLFGGMIKCVSLHELPFSFICLEGINDLIDPYCEALYLKVTVNDKNVSHYLLEKSRLCYWYPNKRWCLRRDDITQNLCSLKNVP